MVGLSPTATSVNAELKLEPTIIVLAVLCLAYLLTPNDTEMQVYANTFLPLLYITACIYGAYQMARSGGGWIFSPLMWFLVSSAVYFGFGPLLYYFGDAESIRNSHGFYFVDDAGISRVNLLSTVFTLIVCAIVLSSVRYFRIGVGGTDRHQRIDDTVIGRFAYLCLLIGLGTEYVVPRVIATVELPAFIHQLEKLTLLGILLLAFLVKSGIRIHWWPLVMVAFLQIVTAATGSGKLSVLLVVFAVLQGWLLAKPDATILIRGLAVSVLIYIVLSPYAGYMRSNIVAGADQSIESRINLTGEYLNSIGNESGTQEMPGVQVWWERLNYVPAQVWAMDNYDRAGGGSTYALAMASFVPRILWPDKPSIPFGTEFTRLLTGEDSGTNIAPGIFAEAYWNGGWWMVLATSCFVGLLFSVFTRLAWYVLPGQGNFAWLPLVFAGMIMGLRPDDWFAAAYIGAIPVALFAVLLLTLLGAQNSIKKVRYS